MDFDTLTTLLAVIGVGAFLWWGALKLGQFLRWIEREEIARQKAEAAAKQSRKAPATAPARESPDAIPAAHIAAIAAAVAAIDGAHAIVHIGVAGAASAWVVEGRWLQQTSHRPH